MGLITLIAGVVIALICAWVIRSVIGLMSGERPESVGSIWWNFFSKMGSDPASYAEPLPDTLKPRKIGVGDRIRVLQLPLEVERSMPKEREELFQRCAGKVLRVENIDMFGALEVHVLDDGTQAPDRSHHILFVEPKYVEAVE